MKGKVIKRLAVSLMVGFLAVTAPTGSVLPLEGNRVVAAESKAKKETKTTKKVELSRKSLTMSVGIDMPVSLRRITTSKKGSSESVRIETLVADWSSSNKKVAAVKKGSNAATITAKKVGKAFVTAKYKGKKYKLKVTVKSPALSKKSMKLTSGTQAELKFTSYIMPKKLRWKSSKSSVVVVHPVGASMEGKAVLVAKKPGTATVTATYNGKKYSCKVTVNAVKPQLTADSIKLQVGESETVSQRKATITKGKKTTWKPSKSGIVTIKTGTNKATFTGKKPGKVTVTVTHNGQKAKLSVTVVKKPSAPNTEKPSSTPSVEEPSVPSTEAPETETETEKRESEWFRHPETGENVYTYESDRGYSYDYSDFTSRTVQERSKGSLVVKTNNPNVYFTSSDPVRLSVSKSGTGTCNYIAKYPGTFKIKAYSSKALGFRDGYYYEGTVGKTITITVSEHPVISLNPEFTNSNFYADDKGNLFVKAGHAASFTSNKSFSFPVNEITTSFSNDKCLNDSFTSSNCFIAPDKRNGQKTYRFGFMARRSGKTVVTVSGGGETIEIPIEVVGNDEKWITYDNWIRNLLPTIGFSKSDPIGSLVRLGEWLSKNKHFSDGCSNYMDLAVRDGDCEASTGLFIDVASRFLGIYGWDKITSHCYEASDAGDIAGAAGHNWAIIYYNGEKHNFDAGIDDGELGLGFEHWVSRK